MTWSETFHQQMETLFQIIHVRLSPIPWTPILIVLCQLVRIYVYTTVETLGARVDILHSNPILDFFRFEPIFWVD